jgi:hypothetical protein
VEIGFRTPWRWGDAGSTLIKITRLTDRAAGDSFNSWLIEAPAVQEWLPDGSGNLAKVGDIVTVTRAYKNKAGKSMGFAGQPTSHFHMPFAILVTEDISQ